MSNVNLRIKHIFVHVPKTGGRSMSCVPWNRADIYNLYGHYTIRDIMDLGIDVSKYYKWCFVRNPWDRILSAYDFSQELKKQFSTFEEFVNIIYKYKECYKQKNYRWTRRNPTGIPNLVENSPHIFLFSQTSLLTIENEIRMDFIGRFENIHEDWRKICDIMKNTGFNRLIQDSHYILPRHHIRENTHYSNKPYKDFYSDEMKDKVAEIYSNDIENFKYTF
jgi:hypothetical protein